MTFSHKDLDLAMGTDLRIYAREAKLKAIPELVKAGWKAVDMTDKRQGQKRTFSKQKSEYLTISPEA